MSSCTKRILSVLLVAIMMLSLLAGCGDKKDDTTKPDNSGTQTEQPGTSGNTAAPVLAKAKAKLPSLRSLIPTIPTGCARKRPL